MNLPRNFWYGVFAIIAISVVGIWFFASLKGGEGPLPPDNPTKPPTDGFAKEVTYQSGSLTLKGYLCRPQGEGPFPAVAYNHGGKEGAIGGAPEETCKVLAQTGFVGFSPIRREELSLEGNLSDVLAGLEYIKKLDYVDKDRVGMIGFSRGGLLTFLAALQQSDLKVLVIMAPAPPQNEDIYSQTKSINAPVLILVAENDTPSNLNGWENLVENAQEMKKELDVAGKDATLIIYPPYKDKGHLMFFEVGDYWKDVGDFLKK